MLTRLGTWAHDIARISPWTNVYGAARTLVAAATLTTLLASDTATLFRPAAGVPGYPHCDGLAGAGLFCVMDADVAHPVAIAILLLACSGWRPRLTALPHWWATVSFQASTTIPDGGDQVAAVLTLLLLPLALTDDRAWHWQRGDEVRDEAASLVAWSALLVIRVQVAGIYLQASMAKLGREEWADGTALYYWLSDPLFGVPGWAAPLLAPVLAHPLGVTLLTWGSIAVEFALVMGLVARRVVRPYLLAAGVFLHASIAVLMGLGSFSLAMIGALVLFLRPLDVPFRTSVEPITLAARRRRASITPRRSPQTTGSRAENAEESPRQKARQQNQSP
ncbi:sporulation-delaying protein SdpB family protein [Nonomuraea sp. NPDC047897]|uniref:sporulation-delaying protein SdpB family protein n=1 Tax=Nonomuraea sp. NPDC047897 TaxID=3364346 RepID=UPI00371D93AC